MIEMVTLDQVNTTALLIMVFVMRNEIKNLGHRLTRLENKA